MKLTKNFIKKLIKEEIHKISEAEGLETPSQDVDLTSKGVAVTLSVTDNIVPTHVIFSKKGDATQAMIAIPEDQQGYFKQFMVGGLEESLENLMEEETLEKLESDLENIQKELESTPEESDRYKRGYGKRADLIDKKQALLSQIRKLKKEKK